MGVFSLTKHAKRAMLASLFLEDTVPRQRRILIVDQNDSYLEVWKTELGKKFHVTMVHTLDDAKELIAESPPFALVIIESFTEIKKELKTICVPESITKKTVKKKGVYIPASTTEVLKEHAVIRALPFIQYLRRFYRKPIIGVADHFEGQQEMIVAGCNTYATRNNLPSKIYEVLNLYESTPKAKKKKRIKKSWKKANPRNFAQTFFDNT